MTNRDRTLGVIREMVSRAAASGLSLEDWLSLEPFAQMTVSYEDVLAENAILRERIEELESDKALDAAARQQLAERIKTLEGELERARGFTTNY